MKPLLLLPCLYSFVFVWAILLAGCAESTSPPAEPQPNSVKAVTVSPTEPAYYRAAVQSSSNDATKCIELIEDGKLDGPAREQVLTRLYAIVKR